MNGKLNLFIRCFICFCAYFYSVNTFAYGLWQSRQSGLVRIGSLTADCRATTSPMYDVLIANSCNDDSQSSCYIQYFSNSEGMRSTCNYSKVSEAPDPTPTPVPTPTPCDYPNYLDGAQKCIQVSAQQEYCSRIAGQSKKIGFDVILPVGKEPGKMKVYCDSSGCAAIVDSLRCLNTASVGDKTKDYFSCTGVGTIKASPCDPEQKKEIPPDQIPDDPKLPTPPPNISPVPTPKPDPKKECIAKGMSFGEVNGSIQCVAKPKDGEKIIKDDTKTETKKNPDGTDTTTKTETTTKHDSSGKTITNTTKTVTTPNGNKRPGGEICTNPAGCVDVESSGKDESTDEFCKENPTSPMCKDGSVTGGCDGAYKCDGEAAVCEISRVQWLERCEELKQIAELKESDLYKKGEEILKSTDLDEQTKTKLGLAGDANTIDVSETFKDSTKGFLSCSRGLNDKTVSVRGKSFSIPFSKMNPFLEIMGKIAVIFTMIVAAKIIIGGVK
nr:hypothetical protein [uncultured Deefgea sp.]